MADHWREPDRGHTPGGAFARSYGERMVDAALLTLPTLGYVDGADPAMAATLTAARDELRVDGAIHPGLLRRYPDHAGDGLPGTEGAFVLCSFWLVEALAQAGRSEQAHETFAALCALAGETGLFAEQLDPSSGDQLGTLPQAFSHVGLINAALRLSDATARRPEPPG